MAQRFEALQHGLCVCDNFLLGHLRHLANILNFLPAMRTGVCELVKIKHRHNNGSRESRATVFGASTKQKQKKK
jgi:hypothetical protein